MVDDICRVRLEPLYFFDAIFLEALAKVCIGNRKEKVRKANTSQRTRAFN
jgi:hypothetical protein